LGERLEMVFRRKRRKETGEDRAGDALGGRAQRDRGIVENRTGSHPPI